MTMFDPVLLAAPAVLHRDDRYTIWHAGVVHGPPGLVVVNLDIVAAEQQQWVEPGSSPVEAYIEAPAIPWRVVGENAYGADWSTLKFHGRFPGTPSSRRLFQPIEREQLEGAQLHVKIHSLDLHVTVDLS